VLEYGLTGTAKSIGIETVRTIKEASVIVPSELEFKMFVISDAHLLTPQAQNGLLKLLEEPPRSVYFMILCENTANLLTTVRSRAPTMRMQAFTEDELDAMLCEDKKFADIKKRSPESFASVLRLASGSYGAAVEALNVRSKKSTSAEDPVRELIAALDGLPSRIVLLASKLPSKRDELGDFMADCRVAFRDLTAVKRTSEPKLLFYSDMSAASEDADRFTVAELLRFAETTADMMQLLDSNVNVGGAQLRWLDMLAKRR